MQKATLVSGQSVWHPYITKTWKVMKLTGILLFALSLHVSAKVKSQTIDFSGKNVGLELIFAEVERQTGFLVSYNARHLAEANPVDIDAHQLPLKHFLDLVFSNQPLKYRIDKRGIIVSSKSLAGDLNHGLVSPILIPPPITVRGRVVNENGEPVMASVLIKGSKRGTTTDADGNFEISSVEENANLIISAANIEETNVDVNRKQYLNIVVRKTVTSLNEVVINKGYYSEQQKLATGNVVSVKSKDIERQPITNPLLALQGRVAGLEITPANGVPGVAPNIRIRGNNSLRFDGSRPLFIIDGVMIDSRPLRSGSNDLAAAGFDPLSTINPSSIQSIEVLKDADATSIYGSRGANGVIIVTTKKGVNTGRINVDMNFYQGVGKMVDKMDMLNTTQYLQIRNAAFSNAGMTPSEWDLDVIGNPVWDTTKSTDWQKELLGGKSNLSDFQIGISGGNRTTTFRLNGNFHNETSIYSKAFGFKNGSGSFSVNHNSLNGKFRSNLSVSYGSSKNKMFNDPVYVSSAITLAPTAPDLYDENGDLNWALVDFGGFVFNSWNNPMSYLRKTHNAYNENLNIGSNFSYEFLRGLSVQVNMGFMSLQGREILQDPISSKPPNQVSSSSTGSAVFGTNRRQSWIVEPQINWNKTIGEHQLQIILGGTYNNAIGEYRSLGASGYATDALLGSLRAATSVIINTETFSDYRYISGFGRIGYNYKNKYLVNLTARRDGSSRFGPDKKYANFGSVGAAWIFSEENFLKNASAFSFGKLRASYGSSGNDQIADYMYYDAYRISTQRYNQSLSLIPAALFNPNFQWEETRKMEFGVNLGFFKDRILLSASWYKHRSSNQLINYALPLTTGFNQIFRNFGALVQNSGWEITMDITPVQTKSLSWTVSGNITLPKNKLVDFPGIEKSSYSTQYKIGEPLSIQRLYIWEGVDPATGKHQIKDLNQDGSITPEDRTFTSTTDFTLYGGVANTIAYKGFELSVLFQFSKQKKTGFNSISTPGDFGNNPGSVMEYWKKEGDMTNIAKPSIDFNDIDFYSNYVSFSTYTMDNASFIRLKTLSIAYSIPNKILSKLNLVATKFFIQGQNLLTISSYKGFDPETGIGMPPLQILTGGVQLRF